MNPFVFHAPTRITFGEGVAAGACEIIKGTGRSSVFIITDAGLVKTKAVAKLLEEWQTEKDLSMTIFTEVMPDAKLKAVERAVKIARKAKCNAFIAIGGGSVMDTAKVVNIALTFGGNVLDYQ